MLHVIVIPLCYGWCGYYFVLAKIINFCDIPYATTKIFSHFSFAFFQTLLGEKISI